MSKEIYRFEKTIHDRFNEYMKILKRKEVLPALEVRREWSYYLDLILEPVGWKAVWQLSREECEQLSVLFPTLALVMVERIDFESLSAVVNVIAMQEVGDIAQKHEIPLVHLYPTIEQPNILTSMDNVANALDQLRFFYDAIWMPWDIDDDPSQDWVSAHLGRRLLLCTESTRKAYVESFGIDVFAMKQECKLFQEKIKKLEKLIHDVDEEESYDSEDERNIITLFELHSQLDDIRKKFGFLESPFGRKLLMIRKKKQLLEKPNSSNTVFVVCSSHSSTQDVSNFFKEVCNFLGEDTILKPETSFTQSLFWSVKGRIIANPKKHVLQESLRIENEVIISGLPVYDKPVIERPNSGILLFHCITNVTFENIILDGSLLQFVLTVRASATLNKCTISCKDRSTTGITLSEGAVLHATECLFQNLSTAIVISPNSTANFQQCVFEFCTTGIQAYDFSSVRMKSSKIMNSSGYAIMIETSKVNGRKLKPVIGNLSLLHNMKDIIQLEDCVIEGSTKGDVILTSTDYLDHPTWSDTCVL